VNAACASSTAGIGLAWSLIREGEEDIVIVFAADYVSRFSFTGFSSLNALSPEPARPFDRNRNGLSLGDGAVCLVLCSEKYLDRFSCSFPLRIAGWGMASDANHITGPARDGRGLAAAMGKALETAGRKPGEIRAYCAHGTGTVYNDAMEIQACRRIFGEGRLPAFSVKGAIGHTLGAAGGLETVFCALALEEETIPPTAGLSEPEDNRVLNVSPEPQSFPAGPVLTANSGFGGINAVLVLEAC
jgi:3-oxoacyl-[acyl-carrier-protein] synthase II